MKRLLLFTAITIFGFSNLRAQNTCSDQLKVAQRRFDDGLVDDIPQLLSSCMESGFTKEEKTNAYKLLIQTYLFSEKQEKANEAMMQFLNEFPSYSIAVNDPKEFVNLFSTYRTKPIFKVELELGLSFCMPRVIEPYGIGNINEIKPSYKTKVGYTAEINYLNKLYKNFDYCIGVSLTFSNFDYTNKPIDYSTVTGLFSNSYIGIPIAVRYNYKFKGINLFTKVGFEPEYLFKSTVDLTRNDINVGRQEPYTGTENLLVSHKRFDIKPLLAIGASFKLGRDWLNVSAGVKFNTMVQFNQQKLYTNSSLAEKYFFTEDKLLLNQSYLSVSYIRPVYKPKKMR